MMVTSFPFFANNNAKSPLISLMPCLHTIKTDTVPQNRKNTLFHLVQRYVLITIPCIHALDRILTLMAIPN